MSRPPVGVRNNNPGNIRFANQTGAVVGELGFAKFATYDEGVAAADRQIRLYYTGQSRNTRDAGGNPVPTQTIAGIIPIYAPKSENDTAAYINTVSSRMGLSPNEIIPEDRLQEFRDEVIRVEIGKTTEEGRQLAQAFHGASGVTSNDSIPENTSPTSPTVSQESIQERNNIQNTGNAQVSSSNISPDSAIYKVDWRDNILSDYDNPSYHFRLFMMSEEDEQTFENIDQLASTIQKVDKIVIAESGNTGISIESVNIKTVTSPNTRTNLVNIQEVQIKLFEPMGMTLYDKLLVSAGRLQIFNYQKCPYYLELKFHGYLSNPPQPGSSNKNGNYVDKIGPDGPNSKVWLYKLSLTDIQSEFTAKGSVYNLTFIQNNDISTLDAFFKLDANFNIQGKTIKAVLDAIKEHKANSEKLHYGYQRNKFEFDIDNLSEVYSDINIAGLGIDLDPETWEITQTNKQNSKTGSAQNNSDDENISFNQDETIGSIVEKLFVATKEGHLLTNRSGELAQFGATSEYILVPWIVTKVKTRQPRSDAYDLYINDYNREILYKIKLYPTTKTTGSRAQQAPLESRSRDAIRQKLKVRIDSGKLVKKYDYLFTGLNTEVLNLDFKFDTLFKATIPFYAGEAGFSNFFGGELAETNAIQAFQEYARLRNQLISENRRLRDAIKKASTPELENDLRRNETTLRNLENSLPALRGAANQEFTDIRRQQFGTAVGTEFLEDLRGEQSNFFFKLTIDKSMREKGLDGSGSIEVDSVQQSMTTAILNQAKDASMIQIKLDIKGDPYWLGVTNLEENFLLSGKSSRSALAEYNSGIMYFVINATIPQGIDDKSGEPILKRNETFTGIYGVSFIEHKFEKGNFTQSIQAFRDDNIDINGLDNFR